MEGFYLPKIQHNSHYVTKGDIRMQKFKFEKVNLEKKDKIKVSVCIALIFLCALISIAFMIFTVKKFDIIDIDVFLIVFVCVHFSILVVLCPSALIFSNIMKRARNNQNKKETAEVQNA